MRRRSIVLTNVVSLWLIVSLLGCSLAWEPGVNPQLDEKEIVPIVARVVEEQLAVVQPVLDEHGVLSDTTRSLAGSASGTVIVEHMLQEEMGSDYLRFCHAVASGADPSVLLGEAEGLMPQEAYTELSARMSTTERAMLSFGEAQSRAIPPSQRPAFMRDLQKLITKTLVLMIAGIVYACIPNIVFWGKITAAAAVSVAAGVAATTIMSIYRYYKYGDESLSVSFQEWIVDVTTDPGAAYAIATSMMTVGKTMTNGPVVTGLILVVFSIYQVMDMVKPLLKKYNFNA
ncbi:MAG: hypothetical protein AB7S52_06880 [Sphaerochaetaceae bacterium]